MDPHTTWYAPLGRPSHLILISELGLIVFTLSPSARVLIREERRGEAVIRAELGERERINMMHEALLLSMI